MSDNYRFSREVALVGAGYWGKNILRVLYEINALKVVAESSLERIKEFSEKYPHVEFVEDYRSLLSREDIKAVAIATPAVTHYKVARDFLEAGKHVYVEKPLALTPQEGEDLVELARKKNLTLMVGHILHYHPAVVKLKELIKDGALGQIRYIYSNRLNIGKIRREENILWSFAPHDISVILGLLNELPEQVYAFGGDYVTPGIYDTTVTELEFSSGVKGHIFVSWLHPYKEQRLVVVGSKAMIVFDDVEPEEKLKLYPHQVEFIDGKIPVAVKAPHEVVPFEKKEPLKEELAHFIHAYTEGFKPLTDGEEGLRVLRVLDAAERALKEGKKVSVLVGAGKSDSIFDSPENKFRGSKIFVHESAYVDEGVEIGEGTKVWHFSHILKGSKIGKNCVLGQNVMVGPDVTIGDRCKIQNNVSVYKGVTLEDEVFVGPSAVFTNVWNPRAFIERKTEYRNTLVKRGATIGANATIVCGTTIGEYAFVGAGAVVTKDVKPHALVVGVPARQKGWVCKCGTPLKRDPENPSRWLCPSCGAEYNFPEI